MPANGTEDRGSSWDGRRGATACLRCRRSPSSSHATTRKNLLEPECASAFVRSWLDVFQVTSADDSALVDAMDAVEEHRMSFWDAVLWAAVRRAGCSAILSEDMQHCRRLGGVEFVNPFAADAATRLSALLEG